MEKKDKKFSICLIIIMLVLVAVVLVLFFLRQVPDEPPKHELRKFYCLPEDREADVCAADYAPVCGFSSENCVEEDCRRTYGNSCHACSNENVSYYVQGEC